MTIIYEAAARRFRVEAERVRLFPFGLKWVCLWWTYFWGVVVGLLGPALFATMTHDAYVGAFYILTLPVLVGGCGMGLAELNNASLTPEGAFAKAQAFIIHTRQMQYLCNESNKDLQTVQQIEQEL